MLNGSISPAAFSFLYSKNDGKLDRARRTSRFTRNIRYECTYSTPLSVHRRRHDVDSLVSDAPCTVEHIKNKYCCEEEVEEDLSNVIRNIILLKGKRK